MGNRVVHITVDDINNYYQLQPPQAADMHWGVPAIDGAPLTDEYCSLIASSLRQTRESWWESGHPVRKAQLHVDTAFWMKFLKTSIKPSKHDTEVDPAVARVLYCIQHRMPLNIGQIIHLEILDAGSEKDAGILPFPCLVTHFCSIAGVLTQPREKSSKDFDSRAYKMQITYSRKLQAQTTYQAERVNVPEAADAQEVPNQHSSSSEDEDYVPEGTQQPPEQSHGQFQLIEILQRIEAKVDQNQADIVELRTAMRHMEDLMADRGFGQGYLTGEERRRNRRRMAEAGPSSQPPGSSQ